MTNEQIHAQVCTFGDQARLEGVDTSLLDIETFRRCISHPSPVSMDRFMEYLEWFKEKSDAGLVVEY